MDLDEMVILSLINSPTNKQIDPNRYADTPENHSNNLESIIDLQLGIHNYYANTLLATSTND